MMIRGNTIKYSSEKKKNGLKEEKKTLEEDIKRIKNELYENGISTNNQTIADLVQNKTN